MIEILGYRKIIERSGGGCHGYSNEAQYEIVYKDGHQLMQCNLWNTFGDCPSGYTSASWGGKDIIKVQRIGELHYVPVEKLELEKIEKFIEIGDYGCERYPSGYAQIREEYLKLFTKTARAKDERQVYIFMGESGIGKSFIGRKIGRDAFETDSIKNEDDLPDEIENNFIVFGNKHNIQLEDITSRIKNAEIVLVDFKKYGANIIK